MIAIIKYNAGNIRSVENAIKRMGYDCCITDDEYLLRNAEKVIFPGVGEASSAMKYLQAKGLDKVIPTLKQPVLGICLGLQLLCKHSEEGSTDCMGVFNTVVRRFPVQGIVPHMGWNNFTKATGSLLKGIGRDANFFYVHNFYAELCKETIATCDYLLPFSAILQKENFYATQFHPEKSAAIGEQLIKNFLEL